ncbi:malate dehydrogenase, partial [Lysinibacillus agricola]
CFCAFVAEELNILVKDIIGFVLGGYGDIMVLLICYLFVGGILLELLILVDCFEEIVDCICKGGVEIVNFFGNGFAYYAPSA